MCSFSYDIPHTCGPDPSVCSLFDFTFIGRTTPWGGRVVAISDTNLRSRAEAYVDQVKKKATLFKTGNKVLVLLGDDFKYSTLQTARDQTTNHNILHQFINAHRDEFHVNIHFSTLSEYFDAIRGTARTRHTSRFSLPSLTLS